MGSVGLLHVATAVVSKSERLVERLEDSRSLPQRHDGSSNGLSSPRSARRIAAHFCPGVLTIRTLCLFLFGSHIMSSNHHSRWGHQMRVVMVVRGCLSLASGRLTIQYPLWPVVHPASAVKHWRPRYPQKATAPPYAAAIHFWARNRPSEERLELSFSFGQDTRPSSERLEIFCSHPIAAPIWCNRRNRGTVKTSATRKDETFLEGSSPSRQASLAIFRVVRSQCSSSSGGNF